MEKIYAFDVDGTLTSPREPIKPEFNQVFLEFARTNLVYLVTGSDRKKIAQQLPEETIDACFGMFTCSGSELWAGERLIYRKEHDFPEGLLTVVEYLIDSSSYEYRFGNHIEHRPGMLNISTAGRNATLSQRKAYHAWDSIHHERLEIVDALQECFPMYEFSAGGEISIDIVPKGWTKAVAKTEIEQRHPHGSITFFGDRTGHGGNDKPLADALATDPRHRTVSVGSYLNTWALLQLMTQRLAA